MQNTKIIAHKYNNIFRLGDFICPLTLLSSIGCNFSLPEGVEEVELNTDSHLRKYARSTDKSISFIPSNTLDSLITLLGQEEELTQALRGYYTAINLATAKEQALQRLSGEKISFINSPIIFEEVEYLASEAAYGSMGNSVGGKTDLEEILIWIDSNGNEVSLTVEAMQALITEIDARKEAAEATYLDLSASITACASQEELDLIEIVFTYNQQDVLMNARTANN